MLTQPATGKALLAGLPQKGLRLCASPDGKDLLVTVREGKVFTQLELPDFEAGQVKLLQREPTDGKDRFYGHWVNGTAPIIRNIQRRSPGAVQILPLYLPF